MAERRLQLGEVAGSAGQPAKKCKARSQVTKKEVDCVCKTLALTNKEQFLQGVISQVEADSVHCGNTFEQLLASVHSW